MNKNIMSIITYVLIVRLFARAVISFRLRVIKQAHVRLLFVNDSRGYFIFKHNVQCLEQRFEEKTY